MKSLEYYIYMIFSYLTINNILKSIVRAEEAANPAKDENSWGKFFGDYWVYFAVLAVAVAVVIGLVIYYKGSDDKD